MPAIKLIWPEFAARTDKEGWPAARLLAALAEHEIAERDRHRIERHPGEARLPPGKTLDSFAFDAVPMISRAQVTALCSGDGWLGALHVCEISGLVARHGAGNNKRQQAVRISGTRATYRWGKNNC